MSDRISKVGKFETRLKVNEFDTALIDLFGINMTDAGISRFDALTLIDEAGGDVRKAAALAGDKRGFARRSQ
jgi:hypothetical protein